MHIDFAPVKSGTTTYLELGQGLTVEDLRKASNESIDFMLDLIADLNDDDVTFDPFDEEAHDPYAAEGEQHIGWSIAHLVAHVTASAEEWASYSAILARGVAYGAEPRLRFETPWKDITTKAQCVQRLEESRRMRNAILDTWPDNPNLEMKRQLSERFVAKLGEFNATACFLFGLSHEVGHYDQFKEVKAQALQVSNKV